MLDRDWSQVDSDAVMRGWPTRDQLVQIVHCTHANPIVAEHGESTLTSINCENG